MKAAKVKCPSCEQWVKLGPDSTVCYSYIAQPWFTHFVLSCKFCKATSGRLFCWPEYEEWLSAFIEHQTGMVTEQFAEDDVMAGFEDVYAEHIRKVKLQTLIPRQERRVAFFNYELAQLPTGVNPHDPVSSTDPGLSELPQTTD